MAETQEYRYDVFISYSHADRDLGERGRCCRGWKRPG